LIRQSSLIEESSSTTRIVRPPPPIPQTESTPAVRNRGALVTVSSLKMAIREGERMKGSDERKGEPEHVPRPTPTFRRRAWLAFQRALDPLAPPKPLRPPRQN
jgi:hypothetical protein